MVAKKNAAKKTSKTLSASKKLSKGVSKKHFKSVPQKTVSMRSFHLYKDTLPFTTTRLTRQTVYWLILLTFIVVTQLWILKLQTDIVNLTALLNY